MAHFVRLEAPTGDARWVNPDHVQFLSASDDGLCNIHFSNEDQFAVRGTPEEIAAKLERGDGSDLPSLT
jgi:hypothetical protein